MSAQFSVPESKLRDIACEEVAPGYRCVEYIGFTLIVDMDTGYINATHLCEQSETGRQFGDWMRLDSSREIIKETSTITYDITNSCEAIQGTYVDPILVPEIAQWASPRFRMYLAGMLEDMTEKSYRAKHTSSPTPAPTTTTTLETVVAEHSRKLDEHARHIFELFKKVDRTREEEYDGRCTIPIPIRVDNDVEPTMTGPHPSRAPGPHIHPSRAAAIARERPTPEEEEMSGTEFSRLVLAIAHAQRAARERYASRVASTLYRR